jgi:hypothetical protein
VAFFQRELAIKEKAYGTDGPKLIASLERLYTLYHSQKNFDQAERYFSRLFHIRENEIGMDTAEWCEQLRVMPNFSSNEGGGPRLRNTIDVSCCI